MAGILTKSDIRFDDFSVSRVVETLADGTQLTRWYVIVGFKVTTVEGEEYDRVKKVELTGAKLTAAKSFLTGLYNQLRSEEGIA